MTAGRAVSTYQSTPIAVLPSVVARAVVLGFVYALFAVVFFLSTAVVGGDTDLRTLDQAISSPVIVASGVAFFVPAITVIAVSYVDYRRRRYVLEDSQLTERRGVIGTREQSIPYDDIEDVSFSRSTLQRLFGAGTIRINDVEHEEGEQGYEFHARYVQNPETFYSELRSALVDETVSSEERPPREIQSAAELSSLSADSLAADTSSDYLMPRAVLHPNPLYPAGFNAALAGAGVLTIGAVVAGVIVAPLAQFSHIEIGAIHGLAVAALALVFVGVISAGSYRRHDTTQYELYDDHVRKITPRERTTVQFANVAAVRRPGAGVHSIRRLPELGTVGHVRLEAADGEALLIFEYVADPDELEAHVERLVEAAA